MKILLSGILHIRNMLILLERSIIKYQSIQEYMDWEVMV